MRLLAVDSSHLRASVAVLETNAGAEVQLLSTRSASTAVSASESLLPLIDEALKIAGVAVAQLDGFAAGVGPGSFTGIRIGLATVKTLAQALDKPVLPVSSLFALAMSAESTEGLMPIAMANAYQGQVFVGWQDEAEQWQEDAQLASYWIETHLNVLSRPSIFVGPGADLYNPSIQETLLKLNLNQNASVKGQVVLTPEGLARAVGSLLSHNTCGSVLANYSEIKANYLRPSQATLNLEKHKQGLVRS